MITDQFSTQFEEARISHRPLIRGMTGMVSSGHHLATQAGVRVLEKGGNAIDAGVAAGICLGVLHPDMVNFAGVAPIMIYLANSREIKTISGLGPWPKDASVQYFKDRFEGKIPIGIHRTVVPAAPDAWIRALRLLLLKMEKRIGGKIFDQLKGKGHDADWWPDWAWKAGAVCVVVVDTGNGVLLGAADPRRESYASGW